MIRTISFKKIHLLFLISPILLLFTQQVLFQSTIPWAYPFYDPNYVGTIGALNLVTGKSLNYITHPGVPAYFISGCLMWIYYFLTGSKGLAYDFFANSTEYIEFLATTYTLAACLVIFIIGKYTHYKTKSISLGLVAQLAPFISVNLTDSALNIVNSETLIIVVSYGFLFYLTSIFLNRSTTKALNSSMFTGFALATKLTTLSYIFFFGLIFLPKIKKALTYFLLTFLFFGLFVSPVINEIHRFLNGVVVLFNHTGAYSSHSGIFNLKVVFGNFLVIFKEFWVYFFSFFLFVFTYFKTVKNFKVSKWNNEEKFLSILGLTQILAFFIVSKKFSGELYYYYNPIIPLGALNYLIYFSFLRQSSSYKLYRLMCISVFCITLIPFINDVISKKKKFNHSSQNIEKFQTYLNEYHKDFTKIFYWCCISDEISTITWGDRMQGNHNIETLSNLVKDSYFYNKSIDKLFYLDKEFNPKKLIQSNNDVILLTSMDLEEIVSLGLNSKFKVKLIFSTGKSVLDQKVYLLLK